MAKETERTPFGERAMQARKAAGLTQERVCSLLEIGQSTLADAETKSHGSVYTAQLANLYGVDAYWLATGVGQMENDDRTWRELAHGLATVQDLAERGQRFATFVKLVDKTFDMGRAEQRLSNQGGAEGSAAHERRNKRTKR